MNRRKARECALCLLYNFTFHRDEDLAEMADTFFSCFYEDLGVDLADTKKDSYLGRIYPCVVERLEEIDEKIKACSTNWNLNRISRVSTAILRLAIFEMLYVKEIPVEVTINEAVELAKKYDHEESFAFVNGVLGGVDRLISAKPERDTKTEQDPSEEWAKETPQP